MVLQTCFFVCNNTLEIWACPNSITPFKEKDETLSPSQVAWKNDTNQRRKKRVIWTIGNVLAIWACTVKEHSGTIKGDVLYVHPLKKEQLNPRKMPWIRSKLPPHQKKNCWTNYTWMSTWQTSVQHGVRNENYRLRPEKCTYNKNIPL